MSHFTLFEIMYLIILGLAGLFSLLALLKKPKAVKLIGLTGVTWSVISIIRVLAVDFYNNFGITLNLGKAGDYKLALCELIFYVGIGILFILTALKAGKIRSAD